MCNVRRLNESTATNQLTRMFTLRERIVASDVWPRLWIVASYAFAFYLLYASLEPSLDALRSPTFCVLAILAIPATFVLTTIVSPFVAFFAFSDVADRQSTLNGGPFSIGDRVVIIPGRNTGRYATVTSFGQCKSLRITIDGDAAETTGYAAYQLKNAANHGMQRSGEVGRLGDG
ncbi:hypothetical protein CEE69_31270 [Rhodopirellula bahusiensis]|uniref:Uncharacterized protein n=2 Tax=Rhodopirellula bahusiensis TaxID=2014065 RepID=A0A2G1VXQ9_9BACT|nr:hypothetical protein CEE69_31270 [Rhodopirellula bahusiensis]